MALVKLGHYLVFAEDLERSKDFYVDVLGLEVGERPPFNFPGYWLYLGDTACVHMAPAEMNSGQKDYLGEREVGKGTGPVDHIAFDALDLKELVSRVEAYGAKVVHRTVPQDGSHQAFLHDPDGIKIELNFPPGEADGLDLPTQ